MVAVRRSLIQDIGDVEAFLHSDGEKLSTSQIEEMQQLVATIWRRHRNQIRVILEQVIKEMDTQIAAMQLELQEQVRWLDYCI